MLPRLLVLILLIGLLIRVNGYDYGFDDEKFIPDECFEIGSTCVRADERMWLVNGRRHYWGQVLTFAGGVSSRDIDNKDCAIDHGKDVMLTGNVLIESMTPEWSRVSEGVNLNILRHDNTSLRLANPIDDSIHSTVNFVLNTGAEFNLMDNRVAASLGLRSIDSCYVSGVNRFAPQVKGQVVIAIIGTRASNGPRFPNLDTFCAIPGGLNVLSLATMNKLGMAHYPRYGAFSYFDMVANPLTHNMFQSIPKKP